MMKNSLNVSVKIGINKLNPTSAATFLSINDYVSIIVKKQERLELPVCYYSLNSKHIIESKSRNQNEKTPLGFRPRSFHPWSFHPRALISRALIPQGRINP